MAPVSVRRASCARSTRMLSSFAPICRKVRSERCLFALMMDVVCFEVEIIVYFSVCVLAHRVVLAFLRADIQPPKLAAREHIFSGFHFWIRPSFVVCLTASSTDFRIANDVQDARNWCREATRNDKNKLFKGRAA